MSGDPIQIIAAIIGVVGNLRYCVAGLVWIHAGRKIEGRGIDPFMRLGMTIGKIKRAGIPVKCRRGMDPTRRLRLKVVLWSSGPEIP